MRTSLLAFILLLVSATGLVAAPLPAEFANLNGQWRFQTDPYEVGESEGWQAPGYDDSTWRQLKAPGLWEPLGITDPRPGQAPIPVGVMGYSDYDGIAWYRSSFELPADWEGNPLLFTLGKVDDWDKVWFNGVYLGGLADESTTVPSQTVRVYEVPDSAARYGATNVLAVQVKDGGGPGGITGPFITLLPKSLMEAKAMYSSPEASLRDRFLNPPSENRILPIWHGAAYRDDADGVLQELLAQGFGGIATNVPFDEATYLRNPAHWANLKAILEAGKAAGLTFWLYDELGYPSGTAGGLTMENNPEWQCAALLVSEADTSGESVALAVPPGQLVLAAAYPTKEGNLDLAGQVDLSTQIVDDKLNWTPPAGDWHIVLIGNDYIHEGAHVSVALGDKLRKYVNLLMAEPTEKFCEVTHEAYAANLGDDLSKYFVSTFTDEPSLQTLWFKTMPYKPLPWSPGFSAEFQSRRGYALEPLLPLLVAGSGSQADKTRYDYWTTVGELVSENYFGVIEEVCEAHNIKSGGHLLLEEPMAYHVPLYGDFFRCIRRLSAPSIDCLTSIPDQVPWNIARLLSSAAELNGDRETMCEQSDHVQRYRPEGDTRPIYQVSLEEIRGSINRLMLGGIHVITSYYNFEAFSTTELRELNKYVGRGSTLLKGGHQVTDIAVLYPSDSLCASFVPSYNWTDDAQKTKSIEQMYWNISDGLFRVCRDFIYVDAQALEDATVAPGKLVHGDLEWQVVVLPKTDTLPIAAWRKLADFWRAGGLVVAAGALPQSSESEFPSAEVQALAKELFTDTSGPAVTKSAAGGAALWLPQGQEFLLPLFLDALLEPDVRPLGEKTPIRTTHRRVGGQDVYMLANDSGEAWVGSVEVAGKGPGVLWEPLTGNFKPVEGGAPVELALGAYDTAFVTFEEVAPRKRLAGQVGQEAVRIIPLPDVKPDWGKGEYVEAELTADEAHSTTDRPAWKYVGTLTKSDTDTFLFAAFRFDPQDVSGAEGLDLRLWAPEGQQSPAQCYVMVVDAAGHTWATSLETRLSDFGEFRALVPFSKLTPASWEEQAKGPLDLTQVAGVVVGWGGYFGKEGERLEYTTALPALFSIEGLD